MSLILDALNRARQGEHAVPGLATQHPIEQLSARRRQYLLWAALSVAVAIIAGLVFDRLRTPSTPEAEIGAPVAELSRNIGSAVNSVTTELKARAAAAEQEQAAAANTSAPAPAAAAQDAAAGTAVIAQPPVQPAAEVIVAATQTAAPTVQKPEQDAPGPETATQVVAAPAASPATPPAIPDDAVIELYQNRDIEEELPKPAPASPGAARRATPDDPDVQQSAEVERILAEARDEMENASLEEHPTPFLADLSQNTKDAIPTLYYLRHDYSSDTSQSSVTLNGNTVKTGGSVVPGMKVEEILPDSVVLNYQGTQFRLRALNSWVNL